MLETCHHISVSAGGEVREDPLSPSGVKSVPVDLEAHLTAPLARDRVMPQDCGALPRLCPRRRIASAQTVDGVHAGHKICADLVIRQRGRRT